MTSEEKFPSPELRFDKTQSDGFSIGFIDGLPSKKHFVTFTKKRPKKPGFEKLVGISFYPPLRSKTVPYHVAVKLSRRHMVVLGKSDPRVEIEPVYIAHDAQPQTSVPNAVSMTVYHHKDGPKQIGAPIPASFRLLALGDAKAAQKLARTCPPNREIRATNGLDADSLNSGGPWYYDDDLKLPAGLCVLVQRRKFMDALAATAVAPLDAVVPSRTSKPPSALIYESPFLLAMMAANLESYYAPLRHYDNRDFLAAHPLAGEDMEPPAPSGQIQSLCHLLHGAPPVAEAGMEHGIWAPRGAAAR